MWRSVGRRWTAYETHMVIALAFAAFSAFFLIVTLIAIEAGSPGRSVSLGIAGFVALGCLVSRRFDLDRETSVLSLRICLSLSPFTTVLTLHTVTSGVLGDFRDVAVIRATGKRHDRPDRPDGMMNCSVLNTLSKFILGLRAKTGPK